MRPLAVFALAAGAALACSDGAGPSDSAILLHAVDGMNQSGLPLGRLQPLRVRAFRLPVAAPERS